jgi:riboflavin kinase / FMN adenylyltransferase
VKVLSWEELVQGGSVLDRPVDLTIGAFDGLHVGHRSLIAEITGRPGGAVSLVITFGRNPALVLGKGPFPGLILTDLQKLERLASLGVEAAAVVDFSDEMSKLTGKAFVGLLKENLAIRRIVVGHDFRFGRNRDTDAGSLSGMLAGTGIEVSVKGPVLHRGSVVSSSRIRKLIQEASFAEARQMLLADHALDLRELPVERDAAGTVQIARSAVQQVLPPAGRYPVMCARGAAAGEGADLEIDARWLKLAGSGAAGATTVIFAD